MKKLSPLSQKGFSAISGLLLVLVLAVVGATGAYVINKDNDEQATTTQSQASSSKTLEKRPAAKVTKDWREYTVGGISLKLPGKWKVSDNAADNTLLLSSDFEGEYGGDPLRLYTTTGHSLRLGEVQLRQNLVTFESQLEKAKEDKKKHGGTYKETTIDGNRAIISSAHEFTENVAYFTISFDANSKNYFFELSPAEYSKAEWQFIDDILSTVTLQ